MSEFSHKITGRGIRPRTRRIRALRRRAWYLHSHRFGGCGSGAARDTGSHGRGQRIHAVHELHRALAKVIRTGDEQLRNEAAQILTEATSRLSGLLPADR
jgi:hypothetical protein